MSLACLRQYRCRKYKHEVRYLCGQYWHDTQTIECYHMSIIKHYNLNLQQKQKLCISIFLRHYTCLGFPACKQTIVRSPCSTRSGHILWSASKFYTKSRVKSWPKTRRYSMKMLRIEMSPCFSYLLQYLWIETPSTSISSNIAHLTLFVEWQMTWLPTWTFDIGLKDLLMFLC